MQKIKAASELYIETEKKKREKAYLGNVPFGSGTCGSRRAGRGIWLGPESFALEVEGAGDGMGWKCAQGHPCRGGGGAPVQAIGRRGENWF